MYAMIKFQMSNMNIIFKLFRYGPFSSNALFITIFFYKYVYRQYKFSHHIFLFR